MITVTLERPDDFDLWRDKARELVKAGIAPDKVVWQEPGGVADLFAQSFDTDAALAAVLAVGGTEMDGLRKVRASKAFLDQARYALCHTDPARFAVLYRVLWRLQRNGRAMEDKADPDVARMASLAQSVRRDIHKMRAFVRFRRVEVGVEEDSSQSRVRKNSEASGGGGNPVSASEGGVGAEKDYIQAQASLTGEGSQSAPATPSAEDEARYIAWFEPEHHILRINASFFVRRFTAMHWSILTPRGSLHWDGEVLSEGPPARKEDAPSEDAFEDLWRGYYASTFNPARLKIGAMMKEMPRKYWKNMPETALIPNLIAGAQARSAAMVDTGAVAEEPLPQSLAAVAKGAAACTRCPIAALHTRAVAGEGPLNAKLMIVGEQPGDKEEASGKPFVGPAGQVLNRALAAAGIDRGRAYLTNAVKHFKHVQAPGLRLHKTPSAKEIDSCRWWLESEVRLVQPQLILALGASAARGLLGKTVSLAAVRGKPLELPDGREMWITAHPSYLLRLDGEARDQQAQLFAQDLQAVAERLAVLKV